MTKHSDNAPEGIYHAATVEACAKVADALAADAGATLVQVAARGLAKAAVRGNVAAARHIAAAIRALPTAPANGSRLTAEDDFLGHLRTVNAARLAAWEGDDNKTDGIFHATELGGEVSEVLNVVKKLHREAMGWRGSRATVQDLADELGDVLICADKLAAHYGIDLAAATTSKFNATSAKVGLPHVLARLASTPAPDTTGNAMVEALTPSADTKAAYSGEFHIIVPEWDEDEEEEVFRPVLVPWDTIKQIMVAIRSRAALAVSRAPVKL